jgi:hypothetical protein
LGGFHVWLSLLKCSQSLCLLSFGSTTRGRKQVVGLLFKELLWLALILIHAFETFLNHALWSDATSHQPVNVMAGDLLTPASRGALD